MPAAVIRSCASARGLKCHMVRARMVVHRHGVQSMSRSCVRPDPRSAIAVLLAGIAVAGCAAGGQHPAGAATFHVEPAPGAPIRFVAYGDMRFTPTAETEASRPGPRQALIAQVAADAPVAVFLNGDVPWHGGTVNDYEVMRAETAVWRERGLKVYPALGNHEFSQCAEAACLENWWNAFPALRGKRWYSVAIGSRIFAIALDSDAPLDSGSEQRDWLAAQLAALPQAVDFVLIYLHHPPVADLQTGPTADHNPRPNERALATFLQLSAVDQHARFLVCAGHIHNYERREQDGVLYLVSGGGGARPVAVVREPADVYQDPGFPNFHYVRFTLEGEILRGEMFRLEDFDASVPRVFARKDAFEIRARPR
jgi:acid phosphatase type 7